MTPAEIEAIIVEELRHIQPGEPRTPQHILHTTYAALRQAYLKHGPEKPRGAVLREAIDIDVNFHPGFRPLYDHEYFKK